MEKHQEIRFFTDHQNWGFLSNFHVGDPLEIDGKLWATVEHYYQAMKSHPDAVLDIYRENSALLESIQEEIRQSARPGKAKRNAQKHRSMHCPENWHSGKPPQKEQVMLEALRVKFAPGTDLANKLLSTVSKVIMEDNPWDSYWGTGQDRCGQNRMGKLLMELRNELRRESD